VLSVSNDLEDFASIEGISPTFEPGLCSRIIVRIQVMRGLSHRLPQRRPNPLSALSNPPPTGQPCPHPDRHSVLETGRSAAEANECARHSPVAVPSAPLAVTAHHALGFVPRWEFCSRVFVLHQPRLAQPGQKGADHLTTALDNSTFCWSPFHPLATAHPGGEYPLRQCSPQ
jgi:hypothetical protein